MERRAFRTSTRGSCNQSRPWLDQDTGRGSRAVCTDPTDTRFPAAMKAIDPGSRLQVLATHNPIPTLEDLVEHHKLDINKADQRESAKANIIGRGRSKALKIIDTAICSEFVVQG